jgi:hypothetical protein
MMRRLVLIFWASAALALMNACTVIPPKPRAQMVMPIAKTLRATGFSRFDDNTQLNAHQRWLSAQQAAKLDAYRDLAAQLYQEVVPGNTTVGAQVIAAEAYRVYVDAFLREARATDYRTIKDSLKATLELTLTDRFFWCVSSDEKGVAECLQEENKMAFTRTGTKPVLVANTNMACEQFDCSDLVDVHGFNSAPDQIDNALLDAGYYDREWFWQTSVAISRRITLLKGVTRTNGF